MSECSSERVSAHSDECCSVGLAGKFQVRPLWDVECGGGDEAIHLSDGSQNL